jgi:hypothetical protein
MGDWSALYTSGMCQRADVYLDQGLVTEVTFKARKKDCLTLGLSRFFCRPSVYIHGCGSPVNKSSAQEITRECARMGMKIYECV